MTMHHLYIRTEPDMELCYNVDIEGSLPKKKFRRLMGFHAQEAR
jgi:hypothetical protein